VKAGFWTESALLLPLPLPLPLSKYARLCDGHHTLWVLA
jgi:hypothetical protein